MNPAAQRGFTMLEVMIAILVVSLGLLGLAALQSVGLKNNAAAAQRTIATQLGYDLADRMRANFAAVFAGDYHLAFYSTTNAMGVSTSACTTSTGSATGCTFKELALNDVYEWNQQICAQLPQTSACAGATVPFGVICIDSTPNDGTPGAPSCDGVVSSSGTVTVSSQSGGRIIYSDPTLTVAPTYVVKIWWVEDRNDASLPLKRWVTTFQP